MTRFLPVLLTLLMLAQPATALQEQNEQAEAGQYKIELAPFNLSLIRRGRVEAKVTILLTLALTDPKDLEPIRDVVPQVRSDFVAALTVLGNQRFRVDQPIDPDIISLYLKPYTDARLGAGKVTVYVRQALIEPM